MDGGAVVCGREFSPEVLERIREEIREHPEQSRSALARQVCQWLGWERADGRAQEVSCRIGLLRLERRGVISLPAPKGTIARGVHRAAPSGGERCESIDVALNELGELEVVLVDSSQRALNTQWNSLMAHHPLGGGPLVGAQVRYLIGSQKGWVGALAFSASAWQLRARDRWIGWRPAARKANLRYVVANSRFLIPPWVRVPHLASKSLALCVRRLARDWRAIYGFEPLLLETYVDPQRFTGSCYRAANWQYVGQTSGRGRQDRNGHKLSTIKDLYVYALHEQCRSVLCDAPRAAPVGPRLHRPQDWAEQELGGARLGDQRLSERLLCLARDFYARPQANVPQASQGRARTKAAYRWLAHEKVTVNEILAPHYEATTRRIAEQSVVLVVQDTTSFNYSTHAAAQGIGLIGTSPDGPKGVLMHDTMAYTVDGLPLGLVDVQLWVREREEFGKKHRRYDLPIEAKESNKWLKSFRAAAAVQAQCPQTTVVSVGDREADIYELFVLARSRPDHAQLLVRAEQDRLVAEGQAHLWEHLERQPICATQVLHVPRTPKRKARQAFLEVRYAPVDLCAPQRNRKLGTVKLWAVLAQEVGAPEDTAPLQWMLLTTLEVGNTQQALEKLHWYTKRWGIEVFHKTLKSGCRIEERQLATVPRIENCLAIDMVVAWRIMHLTMLGRETPDAPCTIFFEEHEWKALYAFTGGGLWAIPKTTPTIREAMRTVATLGGFLGRKSDGEPGVKTLWLGIQRLDDISGAWLSFGPGSPLQPNHPLATSPVSRNPRYG